MAIAPVGQMQTAQPFTWGQGGQRLTPEDIALQRRLAAQQMQQGADFSPIGHWSQGLARVAQGLFGGMRERRADKASEANAAESNAVLQALMGQQSGATGTAGAGNPQAPDSRSAIIAALSNPYLSDDVRKFAGQEYQRLNPKLPAPTELQRNYEWLQGLGMGDDATGLIRSRTDPEIVVPLPSGTYVGPRSGLGSALGGGGQQTAPVGSAAPSTPAPDGGFMTVDQFKSLSGASSFRPGHPAWDVPVSISGDADFDQLPSGKTYVGPDGIVRQK